MNCQENQSQAGLLGRRIIWEGEYMPGTAGNEQVCEENEISLLVRLEGLPQACWGRDVGEESPGVGCACRAECGVCWKGPSALLGQFPDGVWEGAFSKAVPFVTGW